MIKRKDWIDVLRAAAIIFVVFGHLVPWAKNYFIITTPIKIPLFFAISGYVFNDRGGDIKRFFKNWLTKLVVPYFSLTIIPAFLLAFYYGIDYFFNQLTGIVDGSLYWFMPCLIIAEVVWFFILKLCSNMKATTVASLAICMIGFILSEKKIGDFASINTALICQLFLWMGLFIKKLQSKMSNQKQTQIGIVSLVLYIILLIISSVFFDNTSFDIHKNLYYNIPICLSLVFCGCFSSFMLASQIKTYPRFLVYIGQNTLLLYLWAGYAILPLNLLFSKLFNMQTTNLIIALVYTVGGISICMLLSLFINKYVPFLVGKNRKQ